MYTPLTKRGERYREMGYWFATGWWFAQPRDPFLPDRSQEFAGYCAEQADLYTLEKLTSLQSIPDMFKTFQEENA